MAGFIAVITWLKEKRKGKERQELQNKVVDQEEDQEMPTKKEVLSVKPLAQLSPLKEVRQSLILKKKAKFIIARDLKTPNHLISSIIRNLIIHWA